MPAEHHFLKNLTLRLKGHSTGVPAVPENTLPAWDKVWDHPRLLMWNRLDPRGSLAYWDGGSEPICDLPGFETGGQTYIHDNPSSAVLTAGVGNLMAPFRLGKPLIFRGQFTITNGATKNEISHAHNNSGYVTETGGVGGPHLIAFGNAIYTDPEQAAYGLESRLAAAGGGLTGWVRVTYEDQRRGSTKFAFRIESEYPITLGQDSWSGLWHTYGLYHRVGISSTVHEGDRVLHEREFIIWDTGGQSGSADRGGGPSLSFSQLQHHELMPTWFVLPDCNFLPTVNDRNAFTRGDPSESHYSGGAPRLALLASDTLDDLENDWNNPAKFVEGVNMFTFHRYYWPGSPGTPNYTGWPDNGSMVMKTMGRCWGVDGAGEFMPGGRLPPITEGYPVYNGVSPSYVGGNWPNRMVVAHLWKWAWYMGEDAWPHWVHDSDRPPNYRYWMLLIVNRHNPLGRIVIGGPVWLDGGWIPLTMPHMDYYDGMLDRSYHLQNEFGDRLPIERSGQRIIRARWSGPQRLHAMDHRLMNHGALRRRLGQTPRFPDIHALRVARGHLHGRAKPCFYIDPLYDPSGDRRTFPDDGTDPYADWDYKGRYAPRYNTTQDPGTDETNGERPGPPQRLNWKQEGSGTYKAEEAGYDMGLYARGTIFGYAEWFNWRESGLPDKTYNADLMVTEIPEEY